MSSSLDGNCFYLNKYRDTPWETDPWGNVLYGKFLVSPGMPFVSDEYFFIFGPIGSEWAQGS